MEKEDIGLQLGELLWCEDRNEKAALKIKLFKKEQLTVT
jgi:hypothetical protein